MKVLKILALSMMMSTAVFASSATDPQTISFADNQQITLQLSNTDPNRLVVANDSINHITCPGYACDVKNNVDDASGSIYLSVRGGNPHTVFISTKGGRHFSLIIAPTAEPGKTLVFKPTGQAALAGTFEKNSDYLSLLVHLQKSLMINEVLDGFAQDDVNSLKPSHVNGLLLTPIEAYTGHDLSAIKFEVSNPTSTNITLKAQDFYASNVRAISIDGEVLKPGATGYLYEIMSNGGANE